MLLPEVTLVVHPINTDAHPDIPTGWRWAVQVGGGPPSDVQRCANAGWCPTEREARLEGAACAATALNALAMVGCQMVSRVLALDFDPIPASENRIRSRVAPPIGSGLDGYAPLEA